MKTENKKSKKKKNKACTPAINITPPRKFSKAEEARIKALMEEDNKVEKDREIYAEYLRRVELNAAIKAGRVTP